MSSSSLARVDRRFQNWPDIFERGHSVLHALSRFGSRNYWRISSGMPLFVLMFDELQTKKVRSDTALLIELILCTRLRGEQTGDDDYPLVVTQEEMHTQWMGLLGELIDNELSKIDDDGRLSVKWSDVIERMVDERVSVGLQ